MRPLYAGRVLQYRNLKCDHSNLTDLKWKKGRRMTIGKFNLLAFSLLYRSNENAAVIFSSRENFLKKEVWL